MRRFESLPLARDLLQSRAKGLQTAGDLIGSGAGFRLTGLKLRQGAARRL
jgi:hypothetical protein